MTRFPSGCQLHSCPTCCPQSTCHAIPKWLEPFVQQLEAESDSTPRRLPISDTPPPELVDHIARLGIPASERRPDALDRQRAWNMLQALAEWADGGLIDPSTWTVVEAERETGWCVFMGHGPDCECDAGARWVLSPREGER